jgi:membrane-associated phospholipid phosphatase
VREHWLTDVLGGWALGAAVGLACVSFSLERRDL